MNQNQWDNLLSAWVDGELSAEERALVQRRLDSSPEARRELAEIEQLAAWIDDLPRDSLPAGFAAQITDRLVAEIHANAPGGADDVGPATIPLETDRRTGWAKGVGALMATAAALLIVTIPFGPFGDRVGSAKWAQNSPAALRTQQTGDTDLLADAEHPAATQDLGRENTRRLFDESNAARTAPATAPILTPADEADVFYRDLKARSGAAVVDGATELRFETDLSGAQIGQVVEAIQRRTPTAGGAQGVSVVRLTVVDRLQGLRNLQLLLAKNHIPTAEPPPTEDGAAGDQRKQAPVTEEIAAETESPGRLVAVYVEATGPQLASVLEQINREAQFRKLEVDEQPLTLAQLELAAESERRNYADRRFRPAINTPAVPQPADANETDKKPRHEPIQKSALGRTASTGSPAANTAKQLDLRETEKTRTRAPAGSRSGQNRGEVEELARISRQLQLSLSEQKLAELKSPMPQRTPATALSQSDRPAASKPDSANLPQPILGARAAHAPLQVLFVLVIDSGDGNEQGGKDSHKRGTPPAEANKKVPERKPNGAA